MQATAGASVPWVRREPRPQDIDREKNRCVGFVLLIDVGHQETSAEGLSSLMRLDAKFTRIQISGIKELTVVSSSLALFPPP